MNNKNLITILIIIFIAWLIGIYIWRQNERIDIQEEMKWEFTQSFQTNFTKSCISSCMKNTDSIQYCTEYCECVLDKAWTIENLNEHWAEIARQCIDATLP